MAVELPYDPFLYLKAVNEGVPIVTGAPRSAPAERLTKLSGIAFGAGGYQMPAETRTRSRADCSGDAASDAGIRRPSG